MKNNKIKFTFLLNFSVYFYILMKIWSYIFNEVVPSNIRFTLLGIVGIFVVVAPISLLINYFLFKCIKENLK